MGIYSGSRGTIPSTQVIEEQINNLNVHISKLASRRLHLQGLIAKRDRLDYEIQYLKKRIRDDKKATTRRGKPVREEAILVKESIQEMNPLSKFYPCDSAPEELDRLILQLDEELRMIDVLLSLPRSFDT